MSDYCIYIISNTSSPSSLTTVVACKHCVSMYVCASRRFHLILLICMWNTWDCISYQETHLWGKLIPTLSVALHQGVGHVGEPTGLSLFRSCLGNCNIEISCVPAASPSCLGNAISEQASSCFLFCDFLWALAVGVKVAIGSWHTTALYLHFVQLWIFGIVMF